MEARKRIFLKALSYLFVFTIGFFGIGFTQNLNILNANIVYATTYPSTNSIYVKNIEGKLNHLKTSININYLGLKNVGTWQNYTNEIKSLINKLSGNDRNYTKMLVEDLKKMEDVIDSVARVNHVEKSMQPKSEGGYGNALIMKNVPQWEIYVVLANEALDKVKQGHSFITIHNDYNKEYNILNERLEKVIENINSIKNANV